MAALTRRAFLRRASLGTTAGVIAAGLVAGTARLAVDTSRRVPASAGLDMGSGEPLIAHVRDLSTGEIALMVGTTEVVYQDRELAAHLMQTAKRSAGR